MQQVGFKGLTQQGIGCKLSDDDMTVSKYVAV